MTESSNQSSTGFFLYSLLVLIPSIDTAYKYFKLPGIIVYIFVGLIALFVAVKWVVPFVRRSIPERVLLILTVLMFVGLIGFSAVGYSLATSGRFGAGSDADDALVMAAVDVVAGVHPYTKLTYLNNPISPMPGAVIIAIPFAVTGTIYLLNIFWLAILFFVLRRNGGTVLAFSSVALMLAISPTVLQNLATGSDYVANTVYIAIAIWLLIASVADKAAPEWHRIASAIFLGIGLSSRSNFFVLMPLVFSALFQLGSLWQAFKYLGIAAISCVAITLPFYLWDPANFSPILVQASKVTSIETVLPFAGVLIPLSGFLTAGLLGLRRYKPNEAAFYWHCAIAQFVILIFTTVLHSIKLGKVDIFVGQSGYGMFTLVFAAIAFSLTYFGEPNDQNIETARSNS